MEKEPENFKDHVHSGMDRLIDLASRTGSAFTNLTQDTIVKIDIVQLKKKKDVLLKDLGVLCHTSFHKNMSIEPSQSEVSTLMNAIKVINEEIEKRESEKKRSVKKNDEK